MKFTVRLGSPVHVPASVLQQDLHPPSSQVPHVQVQRARDAERDGGDEGAKDKPPQGLLQLQEGRGRRNMAPPLLLVLFLQQSKVHGGKAGGETMLAKRSTLSLAESERVI